MAIKKKDAQAGSGIGLLLGLVWGAYSRFTTVRDLASDAGEFSKMIADPPFEMPWIIAAVSAVALVLIWRLWAEESTPSSESLPEPQVAVSGNNNTVQQHYGQGHNIHAESVQLGKQPFYLSDELIAAIVNQITTEKPFALAYLTRGSLPERMAVLQSKLEAKGCKLGGQMIFDVNSSPVFSSTISIGRDGYNHGSVTIMPGFQVVVVDPRADNYA